MTSPTITLLHRAGISLAALLAVATAAPTALFDGKSLKGWETKHPERWRVENGAIASGDQKEKIPSNFFLFTEKSYADFEFRCKFRLTGDPKTGLINSGIQFRSEHLPNGHARGYQADIGDVEWWGCIYDEHRRNKVIAKSDINKVGPIVKRNDWNEYVIRCEGARSRLWINGLLTVDFVEADPKIARSGKIAVQVHSGGAAMVEFKDLTIEEFKRKESPLTPAEQQGSFSVPEGYTVELVASEETGLPKPITVSFDDAGRMWAITATDYPVDANETPDEAMALWKNGGKDRVVIFDDPLKAGPHTPRMFADGLAMPMGILPWKDGAIVGQGPEIIFLGDQDGDGKADSRKTLIKGFGVQDSHLMPHQFTMMPGGWIGMAQGAFNRSKVVAGSNAPVSFDYCKMGRFRPDGSEFEVISYGLNNIWGLSLGREGEMFIQEANDMNYSVVPFQVGSSFPGIGNQKFKPYAPLAPPVANFKMGGTGLSGLALSEDPTGTFPDPWHEVMFVANPITHTINAVKVGTDAKGRYTMQRLPDFLSSTDEWFRPIAIQFGPDGCLYIVDWYNKIISHNEVPRKHPDRDRERGRLWRVRHKSQTQREVPNIAALPTEQLISHLKSDSTWAMRAAWRQIVFRQARDLTPQLNALAADDQERADARIHALWALRSLGMADATLIATLASSPNRNIRREAAAISANAAHAEDPDAQVRAQAIRTLARGSKPESIPALIAFAKPAHEAKASAGEAPWGGRLGKPTPLGSPYDRTFERYLVRQSLEQMPNAVAAFLDSPAAVSLPAENRLFASLSLPAELSTPLFIKAWADIQRPPSDEELLLLLKGASDQRLAPIVASLFADPAKAPALMGATLRLQDRIDAKLIQQLITPALQKLAEDGGNESLVVEVSSAFRLPALQDALASIASNGALPVALRAEAVNALARIGAGANPTVLSIVSNKEAPPALRIAAMTALGTSGNAAASAKVLQAAAKLSPSEREDLLDRLAGSATGVDLILHGLDQDTFKGDDLTIPTLDRMRALRPNDKDMQALWTKLADRFPRALKLQGKSDDYGATTITLDGPFTVETWIRLDPGVDNADGILGRPGGADFNFYGGVFRIYGGPKLGDFVTATRPMTPGAWTHLAVTRNKDGKFSIYRNGELDTKGTKRSTAVFSELQIGRTTPPNAGTAGELMEFRVWNTDRNATEIRANFNRRLEGGPRPAGLEHYFPLGGDPTALHGNATITAVAEGPELLDPEEARQEEAKLVKFRAIATAAGADPKRGKPLFTGLCLSCHTLDGKGGAAAPPLDGSGHRDLDSLLRAVLTPNAAVEPGYRAYRVETHDGQLAEGFLVKHDKNGAVIRLMGGAELRFPQAEIRRARYLNRSFMIPGLFDALAPQQVADIIAYIGTLKEDSAKPVETFGKQSSTKNIRHSFLLTGPQTALVGEDDRLLWSVPEASRDGSVLPNGNLLIAHAKYAREYKRDGSIAWEYKLSKANHELERATRFADGTTMIVELGKNPQILEVDPKGKILVRVALLPETDNAHMQTRMVRKLPNGNYLAPHLLAFAVKEYNPAGKVVRTIRTDLPELGGRDKRNWPFTAIPLENGHLLVNLTNGNKTVEFDAAGKVVWRADNTTNPGLFADPCGGQRLPNGNTIICSYGQGDPSKPRIFELTPDKKVVWEFRHPKAKAHEVHILTTNGQALPAAALR